MANVFIVHGVGGYPEENWFGWLKRELEKSGNRVFVPQFPTPEDQNLTAWLEVLEKFKEYLTPETIVVGHSLGVAFLLNVIEKNPIKAALFVAGFTGKIGHELDDSMKTFSQREFDFEKIRKNCKDFYVFNSENDPYIRLEKAQELAKNLGTKVVLVKDAGHFNKAAGYTKFDLLLEKIKELS